MPSRAESAAALLGAALVATGTGIYSLPAAMVVVGLLLLIASFWRRAR